MPWDSWPAHQDRVPLPPHPPPQCGLHTLLLGILPEYNPVLASVLHPERTLGQNLYLRFPRNSTQIELSRGQRGYEKQMCQLSIVGNKRIVAFGINLGRKTKHSLQVHEARIFSHLFSCTGLGECLSQEQLFSSAFSKRNTFSTFLKQLFVGLLIRGWCKDIRSSLKARS